MAARREGQFGSGPSSSGPRSAAISFHSSIRGHIVGFHMFGYACSDCRGFVLRSLCTGSFIDKYSKTTQRHPKHPTGPKHPRGDRNDT
jgi:hypothetical protein